ncbi:FAD-binding oxidoreductase [Roseomonas eburnea]|uniref:FAD-binding oxidoreductase n=1 Tax=Neoroseomonas eburnea TaxID=1346889 RepID=A0A9X9XAZ1_9PROT|nr:FAD-binding oxidoreductase [Neoroseomonas eburnea]MBR0680877.1 FAD-binding oxidoreductase [Neoroseomonas eburnea]
MKLASYWLETATPFAGAAAGPMEGRADAVVVGGGFTGLSAALALARQGASVVVLEAGRVAAGASGRNGGHVNNGTSHDFAALAARFGTDHARALYRAYDAAVDTVERIVREEQIQCDFRRSGKIKLAAKPAHYDKLARSFEILHRDCDPDTDLVPRERIREEVGSDAFFGGLLYRKSAMMHMGRFGAGLAEAAARAGARIFEDAPVTALTRRNGHAHAVTTARGTIEAAQVLIATGPSREGPFAWFRRRIVPVGSFIVVTEPLTPGQLDSIMPTRRTATTTKHIGNYFRISPDDRLIWGGRARFAMSNPTEDAKSGDVLRAQLRATFPQLKEVRLDYCWGGLVDMTEDRLPRAGEHEGLFYAMGLSGHGAQMSVHLGQQMAKVIAGDPTANPFGKLDWPAITFNYGTPWFLPLVGAWYSLKDRLE